MQNAELDDDQNSVLYLRFFSNRGVRFYGYTRSSVTFSAVVHTSVKETSKRVIISKCYLIHITVIKTFQFTNFES